MFSVVDAWFFRQILVSSVTEYHSILSLLYSINIIIKAKLAIIRYNAG